MNLIEELGLEKCKQIVDGAPSWASHYVPSTGKTICCHNENHFYFRDQGGLGVEHIRLSDIRAAIDHHYYGQSEEKELEQYAVLSQEKIEGGALFVGDNSKVIQMVRDITDNCSDIKNHLSPNTKVIEG
jgi:hypothetical protein